MRWIRGKAKLFYARIACSGLAMALMASATAGCREPLAAPIPSAQSDEASPRRGGTLHLASFGDVRGLDSVTGEALASQMGELIYAGLVDLDAKANVIPDLATHWERTSDGLTYTFFLRSNVRFHDGEELTADDVKRSMERALHPTTPNALGSFYENLAGFDEYTTKNAPELPGVEVVGRYAVAFHLKKPDATFLTLMALMPARPVCKSAGHRYVDTWSPCGAGPFKLLPGGWEHGRSLTLVRHEGYFRPGLPYLDAVNVTYGMNLVTQRFKFEAGVLDVLRETLQADALRFQNDPRWKPYATLEPSIQSFGENMNTEMPPFDNVEVRRAVACAIDREQYHLLRASNVSAHTHAVPADVPGYNPNVPGQKLDLAEALEHMRKAGFPYDPATGRGGYEPHIEYVVQRQSFGEYTAQVLKQSLAKIGIRIDIRAVNFPTYLALTHRRHRVAFSPQGWSQDYPDAIDFYDSLFASKSINDEDSSNSAFYKNPTLDDVLEQAHHELDPAARQALLDRAESIVQGDAPWAFTHSYRFVNVRQPYVRNYRLHPSWTFEVREMWFDRIKDVMVTGALGPLLRSRTPERAGMATRRSLR
ncbi:ABC transporter substrate-binding protein [Pendulispora albinea]|uniref:ABC transporter substrate-binding protein n=1 Tax=Pendulispora albinea TaxID=2741071 RepID=A0ABZ2LR28_9BACT